MFRIMVLAGLVLSIGLAGDVSAQDAAQRTRDLVAALDKTKHKKKEKASISIELFVDVRNEPVVKQPSEYGGVYEADGYRLELHVEKGGSATGSGHDTYFNDDQRMNFTLRDARIEGALLTGTKVYSSGEAIPFEAVFVNRTSRVGTKPELVTASEMRFGLGFIQTGSSLAECDPAKAAKTGDKSVNLADVASKDVGWTNRVFLEKK